VGRGFPALGVLNGSDYYEGGSHVITDNDGVEAPVLSDLLVASNNFYEFILNKHKQLTSFFKMMMKVPSFS